MTHISSQQHNCCGIVGSMCSSCSASSSSSSASSSYFSSSSSSTSSSPTPLHRPVGSSFLCPFPYRDDSRDGAFVPDNVSASASGDPRIPTTNHSCSITYAEYLGSSNTIVCVMYSCILSCMLTCSITQAIRLIRHKGWKPVTAQHMMFATCLGWSMAGVCRIPDPRGWAKTHHFEYIEVMLIVQNICAISAAFLTVMSWVRIMKSIQRQANATMKIRITLARFEHIIMITYAMIMIIAVIVQIHVQPYWIGWVVALSATVIMLSFILIYGLREGISVFRTLKQTAIHFQASPLMIRISQPLSPQTHKPTIPLATMQVHNEAVSDVDVTTGFTTQRDGIAPVQASSPSISSTMRKTINIPPDVNTSLNANPFSSSAATGADAGADAGAGAGAGADAGAVDHLSPRLISISHAQSERSPTATSSSSSSSAIASASPISTSMSATIAIWRVLLAATCIGWSVIAFLIYAIVKYGITKPDLDTNPPAPPESAFDIASAYAVDTCSFLIIGVIMYSFRHTGDSSSSSSSCSSSPPNSPAIRLRTICTPAQVKPHRELAYPHTKNRAQNIGISEHGQIHVHVQHQTLDVETAKDAAVH